VVPQVNLAPGSISVRVFLVSVVCSGRMLIWHAFI
jgi:hypothetical protein